MNQQIEIRLNEVSLESVAAEETNDSLVVEGYVNETNKWSLPMRSKKGPFIETIVPGAFKKALKRNTDIHFLAEHDSKKILSSTRNNSLTLSEDEKGLKMKATISKTSYGKDYYQLIKDGILGNMSFGFRVIKDSWVQNSKGVLERSISDLDLFEVSVVTNPAYPTSSISARGLDLVEEVDVPEIKEETMEENRNTEEKEIKQEEKEDRAYVSSIWSKRDLLSECLTLQEKILTIATYHSSHQDSPFEESDIITLKSAYSVIANKMLDIAAPTTKLDLPEDRSVEKLEEDKEIKEDVSKEIVKEDTTEGAENKEENNKECKKSEKRSEVDPLETFKSRLEKIKEISKELI